MYSIPSSAVVADSPCNAAANNGEKCQSFNVRKGTTNKSEKIQKAANLPDRTREQESSATDQSEQGKEMGQLEGGGKEGRGSRGGTLGKTPLQVSASASTSAMAMAQDEVNSWLFGVP